MQTRHDGARYFCLWFLSLPHRCILSLVRLGLSYCSSKRWASSDHVLLFVPKAPFHLGHVPYSQLLQAFALYAGPCLSPTHDLDWLSRGDAYLSSSPKCVFSDGPSGLCSREFFAAKNFTVCGLELRTQ